MEFQLNDFQEKINNALEKIKPFEPSNGNSYRFNFGSSQIGLSNLFAEVFKEDCCFIPELKKWHIQGEGVWKEDIDGGIIKGYMLELVRVFQIFSMKESHYQEDTVKTFFRTIS